MTFRLTYRRLLIDSYRDGTLSRKDYRILLDAHLRPNRRNEQGEKIDLNIEVEKYARRQGGSIWSWIKAHWFEILKLILSLLPLFLMVDNH